MAAFAGPNVVEDGLVLALDAGNTKSYPGSGTTWTDLMGRNNGTLTNGPTFSLNNGGTIVFDGSTNYITISDDSDFTFGTEDLTVEAWFKPDSSATVTNYHTIISCGWPLQLYWQDTQFKFWASTANSGAYFVDGNSFSSGSNSAVRDVWHHIVVTRSGSDFKMYLNGVLVDSASSGSSFGDPNADTKIGQFGPSNNNFADGEISIVKLYKGKALTAAEVEQNFNAIKNRYKFTWSLPASPDLYSFTSAFFTVSQSLTDSLTSDEHRFGPTQTEVRAWLSGPSNGGGSHSWANTYVDCPVQGYQRWTIPKTGKYRITAKGGGAGRCQQNHIGRGVKVIVDFNLTKGEKLILAAGQGVPDRLNNDSCNGGGGASWVMSGDTYTTAIPLIVASGAGGDTSDGSGPKDQPNVVLGSSITVTPTNGEGGGAAVTGKQTSTVNSNATTGRGSQEANYPNSAGWLSDGADAGENDVGGHCFRTDLVGGIRSNSTAGYGGFGGGSGGEDEYGNASGGFTGAYGTDSGTIAGNGSSFVNDNNEGNVSVALAQATTTFQNTDYTSEDQYQGWVKIEFIS